MLEHKPMKERVKAGAKFLDKKIPGWYNKIDLETLQMYDCMTCILGQLYYDYKDTDGNNSGYFAATEALFGGTPFSEMADDTWPSLGEQRAINLGFNKHNEDIEELIVSGNENDPYEELNVLWIAEIMERRNNENKINAVG